MSILIKGMEMPNCCAECKLISEYDEERFCPFFNDNVEYWIAAGRRHEDCPLNPVSSHGRLIDADALCDGLVSNHPVVIHASSAPTIIPASDKEAKE